MREEGVADSIADRGRERDREGAPGAGGMGRVPGQGMTEC